MRATWLTVTVLAALGAGCGEGRVIFDLDVYSFLQGAGTETLPYGPGLPDTIPAQGINALGIGGASIVDTVRVTGTVDFENVIGTGSVTYQVHFDSLADSVYRRAPAFGVTGTVTPGGTTTSPFDIPNLPDALKPLFLESKIYVGIRASTAGAVQGTARLTALRARIVVQEQVF